MFRLPTLFFTLTTLVMILGGCSRYDGRCKGFPQKYTVLRENLESYEILKSQRNIFPLIHTINLCRADNTYVDKDHKISFVNARQNRNRIYLIFSPDGVSDVLIVFKSEDRKRIDAAYIYSTL